MVLNNTDLFLVEILSKYFTMKISDYSKGPKVDYRRSDPVIYILVRSILAAVSREGKTTLL